MHQVLNCTTIMMISNIKKIWDFTFCHKIELKKFQSSVKGKPNFDVDLNFIFFLFFYENCHFHWELNQNGFLLYYCMTSIPLACNEICNIFSYRVHESVMKAGNNIKFQPDMGKPSNGTGNLCCWCSELQSFFLFLRCAKSLIFDVFREIEDCVEFDIGCYILLVKKSLWRLFWY